MSVRRWMKLSIGRWAAPVCVLVVAVHVATRSSSWRYEWLRGVLLLTFSCVFLGPLAAGFATWEGSRWARAELLQSSGRRPGATATRASLALDAWLVTPLVLAAVTMTVVVKLSGVPGVPRVTDLAPLLAAVAMIVAWSTIGFAIGWCSRSTVIAAPLVAGGSFALVVALWGGPGQIMEVGGTYTTLVGLRVKPAVTGGQILFWCGLVIVGIALVNASRRRVPVPAAVAVFGLVVAVGGFTLTQHGDGLLFTAAAVSVHCEQLPGGTDLCLAPGYETHRSTAAAATQQALARWRAAGLPPPERFSQAPDFGHPGRVWLDETDVLRGDVNDLEWQLVNSILPPGCDTYNDLTARRAFDQISSAVVRDSLGTTGANLSITTIPNLPSAQVAQVRQAAQVLSVCGQPSPPQPHR